MRFIVTITKYHRQCRQLSLGQRRYLENTSASSGDNDKRVENSKLIYEGKLTHRILYLKSLSIVSSLGLSGSYGYVISQKGISIALAGVGFAFTPFLLSPFVIAWFFKRYITRLYYNPDTDAYTAHHYGLLLNKKSYTFKREDVIKSDVTSILNTFTVGKKPFFLHDEDLKDYESVEIYKKMIGLDQANVGDNKG